MSCPSQSWVCRGGGGEGRVGAPHALHRQPEWCKTSTCFFLVGSMGIRTSSTRPSASLPFLPPSFLPSRPSFLPPSPSTHHMRHEGILRPRAQRIIYMRSHRKRQWPFPPSRPPPAYRHTVAARTIDSITHANFHAGVWAKKCSLSCYGLGCLSSCGVSLGFLHQKLPGTWQFKRETPSHAPRPENCGSDGTTAHWKR